MSQTIAIIGAGLSGLTAGYRLQKNGYRVRIFEARKRAGGRVHTVPVGNSYEELGGKSLCDGNDGKSILALIDELRLKIIKTSLCLSKNFIYQSAILNPVDHLRDLLPPIEQINSAANFYQKKFNNLGEIFDELFGKDVVARRYMEMRARNYEGSNTQYLSSHYIHYYLSSAAEMIKQRRRIEFSHVEHGNSQLINTLTASLSEAISYQHILCAVKKTKDGQFNLQFTHGEQYNFDYAIITIPCTTLRDVKFSENMLAADQIQAITTLQYGSNAKILLPVQLKKPANELIITDNAASWLNEDSSVLTLYFGGTQGVFANNRVPDIVNRDLPAIRLIYPQLELISANAIAKCWINDPFAKGSYSNFGIGQYKFFNEVTQEFGENVKKVFRSVDGKLFFAGEHTNIETTATLEAAVASGEKAARMVQKSLTTS